MPEKHLVLDEDVHEGLKRQKRRRGSTLRQIGNAFLRTALDRKSLVDEIARHLIRSGKVSEADYNQAKRDALAEIMGSHRSFAECLQATENGTYIAGSWEIAVMESDHTDLHVIEAWARDGAQRPLPLHCHEASEGSILVLEGQVLIAYPESERLLSAADVERIPRGAPHTVTPVTETTRAIVICTPSDPTLPKT